MLAATKAPLVVLSHPNAHIPQRGSSSAAGWDLYSSCGLIVKARSRALCDTGIRMAIPQGQYGRIAPRSGLASRHSIDVSAGVIDADYRGEIKVLLVNNSDIDYEVRVGDKIAQIIIELINVRPLLLVANLEETERGEGGFGSTGYRDSPSSCIDPVRELGGF